MEAGGYSPTTGSHGAALPESKSHKPFLGLNWQRRMVEISKSGVTGGGLETDRSTDTAPPPEPRCAWA